MASQEALKEHCIEQIRENGFVTVSFGICGADIDTYFTDFREFLDICEEPGGQKFADALAYSIPGREDDGTYWVQRRRLGEKNPFESIDRAPATESKDTAHVGPQSIEIARLRLGAEMPKAMARFLEGCTEIHEAAKSSVRPVFSALGIENIMLAKDRMKDVHLVRPLRYIGTTALHQAGLHFDRSKFTLAPWESKPELVGAPGNNGFLEPISIDELDELAATANNSVIDHQSGSAKLFAGAGYNRLDKGLRDASGNLPLLLHGVINRVPEEERDAVVVFMNHHVDVLGSVARPDETGFNEVRARVVRQAGISRIA